MNRKDNRMFLIIGVLVAILIGVLAVFFASGDPDGLESTALVIQGEKTLTGPAPLESNPEAIGTGISVYSSPFPDYSIGGNMGPIGSVVAMIAGILITLAVVLGATRVIALKK